MGHNVASDFTPAMSLLFWYFRKYACIILSLTIGSHADGFIHFLHRNLQLTNFRAYQCRVSHLIQLKQHNMLISVGVSLNAE